MKKIRWILAALTVTAALALLISSRPVRPVDGTGIAPGTPSPRAKADLAEATRTLSATSSPGEVTGTTPPTPPPPGPSSVEALAALLRDSHLPLAQRRHVLRELAKNGSPEAIAALRACLATADLTLRAAIAESLGAGSGAQTTLLLLELLNDADFGVSQAAVRGLAAQGSAQAVTALAQVLHDPQRPLELRCDAASELGSIRQPGVVSALTQAAMTVGEEDVLSQVLVGLGRQDITETSAFFSSFLKSPTADPEMKIEAVEALAEASGDVAGFLAALAADSDPAIRTAAAWTLSATDEPGNLGPQLLTLLQKETNPDVRLRLYQALGNQQSVDSSTLLNLIQREPDAAARLAGFDLAARTLRDRPTTELTSYFEQTALPELRTTAASGGTAAERNAALLALTRARTPGAVNVLNDLAQTAPDPRIREAAAAFFRQTTNNR